MAKKNDPAPKALKGDPDSSLASDDDGDERGFLVPEPEPEELTSVPEPTPEPPPEPTDPAPITPQTPPAAAHRRVLFENQINREAEEFGQAARVAYLDARLAGKTVELVVQGDDEDDEATDPEGG